MSEKEEKVLSAQCLETGNKKGKLEFRNLRTNYTLSMLFWSRTGTAIALVPALKNTKIMTLIPFHLSSTKTLWAPLYKAFLGRSRPAGLDQSQGMRSHFE